MPTPDGLPPLPADVRRCARLTGSEVMWPLAEAAAAVNALADAGRRVLGLDVRDYDEDGRYFEHAWSLFDGDDVEEARAAALAALNRPCLPGGWVVVTWA